jgi:hypothetical protein
VSSLSATCEPGILAIRDAIVRSRPYAAAMVIALIEPAIEGGVERKILLGR